MRLTIANTHAIANLSQVFDISQGDLLFSSCERVLKLLFLQFLAGGVVGFVCWGARARFLFINVLEQFGPTVIRRDHGGHGRYYLELVSLAQ